MTDIVISVAREKWADWLRVHGAQDRPGHRRNFYIQGAHPPSSAGDRLYVASHGRIRCVFQIDGIQPLRGQWFIWATFLQPVAVDGFVQGFPGWKRRWWERDAERAFSAWRTEAVSLPAQAHPEHTGSNA